MPIPQQAGASQEGGQTGRHKKRSRSGRLRLERLDELNSYAAAAFFVTFVDAFMGGFDLAVFAAFVFSLTANSCLTVAVIAATSTL